MFGSNLVFNRDDFGRPIWLNENPNRYDFENFKENTPEFYRNIAREIFISSGRSVDVSPEALQYGVANVLGGLGGMFNRFLKMEVMEQKGIAVGEGPAAVAKHTLFSPFVNRDALNAGFRMWDEVKRNLADYQRAVNSPTVGQSAGPIDPKVLALGRLSKQLDSEYTRLRNRVREAKTRDQAVAAQQAMERWYRDAARRYNMLAPDGKLVFVANDPRRQ